MADPDASENVLTVRDDVEAERRVIPRSKWQFARVENGKVVPDPGRVYLEGGFQPQKIYEVVYVSENPPLVGLGPVAIRDVVSTLKYEGADALGVSLPTATIARSRLASPKADASSAPISITASTKTNRRAACSTV